MEVSKMRTLRSLIFSSLFWEVALHLSLLALAQPSGFISIDCGGDQIGSYVESDTNITYISDRELMEFGEIKSVDPNYIYDRLPDYLRNLRTFTKGNRTCYHLSVAAGSKYLLRTSFYYGNYDGSESNPRFDLYLENTFVQTVSTSTSIPQDYEFIVTPIRNYLTLCLCKTSEGDNPFISAIELRPIPDEIYPVVNATLVLKTLYRFNFGARNQWLYRYPDDVFDRFWQSPGSNGLIPISTSSSISLETDPYKPPLKVMQTAVINPNNSDGIEWNTSILQTNSLFMCLHFAELEHLPPIETRQFSITVNQAYFAGPITPSYLKATNVCSSGIYGPQDVNDLLLTPTGPSNLSPILNAAELYAVVQLSSSATNDGDVNSLLNIRKIFGISKPWSGDPCLPLNYPWEGLLCSNDSTSPPRVISLDLSNSGLSGEIPTSLTNLTALLFLNLAGNNLTGSIPDFLANLTQLTKLDLSNIGLNGEIPTSLANLTALRFLNLADNKLIGSIPDFLAKLTQLIELDLSNNGLNGEIPTSLANLTALRILNLAHNNLTGSIPDFLANLTQLTELNLEDNSLSGTVPAALLRKEHDKSLLLRISGNEQLCSTGVCDTPQRKISLVVIIGLSVFAAVLSLLVVSLVVIRRKKIKLALEKGTAFTYSEIVQMTDHFKQKIGEGGYGPVFYGHFCTQDVAVKILANKSKQGSKEFHTEIALLLRVHHRNLVSFLGYCDEGENMILVFEFLSKGNLRETLSGKTQIGLTWMQRLQIALDAAHGLEYLHFGCRPAIIHRDVKTANILLNDKLQAKLADFGLSKSNMADGVSHISTTVAGTPGYLDPEYSNTSWLNEKSDVYSFGVVLLELISGKQPVIVEQPDKRIHISQWIRGHLLKGNHEKVADPNLHGNYNVPSFWRVADLALDCTADKGIERPNMNNVVTELREAISLCNTEPSFQFTYNDAQQKPETSNPSYNSNLTIDEEILPAPR